VLAHSARKLPHQGGSKELESEQVTQVAELQWNGSAKVDVSDDEVEERQQGA